VTENRLELIAPDLSARLFKATEQERRQAALLACEFALSRNPVDSTVIRQGMATLRAGGSGDATLRKALQELTEKLDAEYFDLQEAADRGQTDSGSFLNAFRRARAANAVLSALNRNSLEAATESIYEAHAASEDIESLRTAVFKALES
jgi:hypothetical protein